MIRMLVKTFFAIIVFALADYVWLSYATPWLYTPHFRKIQHEEPRYAERIIGGVYAWALLGLGIVYFVIPLSPTLLWALLNGAMYGLVVYGVYNGTNYTTFNGWTVQLWGADNLWGMVASALVSSAVYLVSSLF